MTTTETALRLISRPIGACPHSFLEAGVGARYSARIQDLRDAGYVIDKKLGCDIIGHSHPRPAYLYTLTARPGELGQTELAL